jgi:hypothetical protein
MKKACFGFLLLSVPTLIYSSLSIGAYSNQVKFIFGTIFFAFLLFFGLRLVYKKKSSLVSVLNYLFVLAFVFVFYIIGLGGVINDEYKRLEVFKDYESNSKLEHLKEVTKDGMLRIDLEHFKNSKDFHDYIHEKEKVFASASSAFYALILALILELVLFRFQDFLKSKLKKPSDKILL